MSHVNVGQTYEHIIKDVIESSKIDFEEGGVEEAALEELKAGWQRKLSQLGVATFPWDPKPEPAPVNNAPPQAVAPEPQQPDASSYAQAQLNATRNAQPLTLPIPPPTAAAVKNGASPVIKPEPGITRTEPMVKQEPGLKTSPIPTATPVLAPNQMRGPNVPVAAQRAAQALEGQFGPRAAASINAIHTGMSQGAGAQGARPGAPGQAMNPQQYRQQVAALQQQRAQQTAAQNAVANGAVKSQVDGPADDELYEGVLLRSGADSETTELGRVEIDRMLHDQIAANAQRMEGGGLMLPLREATKKARGGASGVRHKRRRNTSAAQHDGPGDDDDIKEEDSDDDAINSDLDDPEEDMDDDEDDDEAMGHIMLCMWDKVQRVKNKWKCTLKDGVLTVNGKEYVFHKATGEYEW